MHGVLISLVISLTVFIKFSGIVVLFVMLVMGRLGGSFGLPPITTTTATTMAAVAKKTNAGATILSFFLNQPDTSSSRGSPNGKAS